MGYPASLFGTLEVREYPKIEIMGSIGPITVGEILKVRLAGVWAPKPSPWSGGLPGGAGNLEGQARSEGGMSGSRRMWAYEIT